METRISNSDVIQQVRWLLLSNVQDFYVSTTNQFSARGSTGSHRRADSAMVTDDRHGNRFPATVT